MKLLIIIRKSGLYAKNIEFVYKLKGCKTLYTISHKSSYLNLTSVFCQFYLNISTFILFKLFIYFGTHKLIPREARLIRW